VKCVTFVSDTFTRYGSNITNVWQEILTPVTLAFSCEVVPEKLWKSVNICKSYGEKISGTFFIWTRCIIPAGSRDYRFLNSGSRDWKKGSGIAIPISARQPRGTVKKIQKSDENDPPPLSEGWLRARWATLLGFVTVSTKLVNYAALVGNPTY